MPNILLSGPAGGGKSQVARELLDELAGPSVLVDFQSLYAALSAEGRLPDGRYPPRAHRELLPLVERTRQQVIRNAVESGFNVVATNSDGDFTRRRRLLELLGPGATERVVDPGRDVVVRRLTDEAGLLSGDCQDAVARWYLGIKR